MPPPFELSLCHLPDMSNASFSFQIPTALTKGDLLLGDDDVDFFRNVDDTPGSSRTTHTPLTLADLTPKASVEIVSGTGVPTPPAFDQQYNPKSKKLPPQGIKRVAHGPPTTKADSRSNKKVTRARAGEASPAVARLRALRTEVEMLNEDLRSGVDDVVSSNSTVGEARDRTQGSKLPKAIANRKHTVISGGITKSRSKNIPFKSIFARSLVSAPHYRPSPQLPEPTQLSPEVVECEEQNPDASLCSTTSGGVAERLVTYSQKFINSFGLFTSDDVSAPEIDHETTQKISAVPDSNVVNSNNRNPNETLLTLSQLSPHKRVSPCPPSPAATAPMSPMRRSSKRPVSVASSRQESKKAKTTTTATSKHVAGPFISKDAKRKLPSGINSSSSSRHAHAIVTRKTRALIRKPPAATTTAAPPHVPSEALDKSGRDRSGASPSSNPCSSYSQAESGLPAKLSVIRPAGETSSADSSVCDNVPQHDDTCLSSSFHFTPLAFHVSVQTQERGTASDDLSQSRHAHSSSQQGVNLTKPIEFTFQLDTRTEARKVEYVNDRSLSRKKQRTQFIPVPDFKTLHAHHEAEIAHRKENIHPTVPLPLELHTNERAKEREKFDRMMKEKERELERVMEQRRREREENEEREVRELRKKAIPRAHEVPEWYNEAPKKKSKVVVGQI